MADPKLKQAMAEIRAIIEKYDCGAAVTLVSATHTEFAYFLEPSWSAVNVQGNRLRFKAKRADFKTAAGQQRAVELSVGMLLQLRDMGEKNHADMQRVVDMLAEHFEIDHKPFHNFEPDFKN